MFSVVWLAQKHFSTVMKTNTKLVIKLIRTSPNTTTKISQKKKKKKKLKKKMADGAMGQGEGRTIGLGS
jgi:hypothetical protein